MIPPPQRHVLTWPGPRVEMAFRLIPSGSFRMGSRGQYADEEPTHRVQIAESFWMAETPLTQAQFGLWTQGEKIEHENHFMDHPDHPAENMNWREAVACCSWLTQTQAQQFPEGFTLACLPTEAEWEYACRAGSRTRFSFGDDWNASLANVLREYHHTLPVGSFAPNAFGLYDMHGQVREWCQDWYRREYYRHSPVENPPGPDEGESRVLRGGSWDISSELYARSAYRVYFRPDGRLVGIGFRVVCEMA
jgi:sulfatase modifying factor 1